MERKPEFGKFPRLETERLSLRKLTGKDNQALLDLFSNLDPDQFTDFDPVESVERAKDLIDWANKRFKRGQGIYWGIIRKGEKQLIGICGFNSWSHHRSNRAEIVYDLGKLFWGQGYAGEALEAAIEFGYTKMSLNRVEAIISPENTRAEILLRKLGFQMEGILREYSYYQGRYWDKVSFSLLRGDWLEGQASRKTEKGVRAGNHI